MTTYQARRVFDDWVINNIIFDELIKTFNIRWNSIKNIDINVTSNNFQFHLKSFQLALKPLEDIASWVWNIYRK